MQNSLWQALLTSLRNRTSHGCHGILTIAKFAWNPELSESQSSLFCSHQINQPRSMKGWPSSQKPGRETSEAAKASNKHHTQQGDVWSSERIIRVSFAHCTTALFRALFLPALLMTTHRQPRSVTLSHSYCGCLDNPIMGEYSEVTS